MPITQPQPVITNDKGTLAIAPDDDVKALSWGTWTFRWTLGFDVEPGGGMDVVLVPRFPTNRWSLPQTTDPTAPGYVTAKVTGEPDDPNEPLAYMSCGGEALLDVEIVRWPTMHRPHGATLHVIRASTGGRIVRAGETLEVTYGDKRGGSLGSQAQSSARVVAFPVFVSDGHAPRFFERFVEWNRKTDIATLREQADFNPSLRVVGGDAASFHVVAPMEVEPGAPFALRVTPLDQACNAASDYDGSWDVMTTDPAAPSSADAGAVTLATPGFHRVYAIDADRGILGVSNPVRVVEKTPTPVYWGEIHGHSEMSDGNGTPDEHYRYARDVALLDFASVCDHDKEFYAHMDRWDAAADRVEEYDEPGRFVPILSYENRVWNAEQTEPFGDINVYYRAARDEIIPQFILPVTPDQFQGRDVVVIPHHPLYGPPCNLWFHWKNVKGLGPDVMPLVEIFSTHGNSEYLDCPRHVRWQDGSQSVVEALKMGYRLGFIGSSDYHEVLTGSLFRVQDSPRTENNAHMQARCGLAAVRADELSRGGLIDAMKARRTFATSGIRAYVDFAVNDHEMGTEFTIASADEPRRLRIAVAAPERIEKLEVIRNGDAIADLADGGWWVDTEFVDPDPIPDGAFYYLRVTTERTDFAWSSPVWVDVG